MSATLHERRMAAVMPLPPLPPLAITTLPAPALPASYGPEWLSRIQCGDPAAHEALFRAFAPGLYAFLSRYVRSSSIAEDLVQDLFLAIWDHRAELRIDGSIRTYLFTAARNRAFNYLKHERVADRFRATFMDRTDASDPSAPGEADFLAAMEAQAAIERLPPRCRLIFTMSRQQDMTYNQIAVELGLSVKTVEVQMGRALKSLRAHHREFCTSLTVLDTNDNQSREKK